MKKIFLILLVLIVLLTACQQLSQASKDGVKGKSLSDMQITACNAAHEAGTCDTRLAELGIVLKEDCCQSLGKCC